MLQGALSQMFMLASHNSGGWLAGKIDEMLTHGIGSHLVGMMFFGLVGLLGARIGTMRAIKSILSGGPLSSDINLSETYYWPSGRINHKTGQEYVDQDIMVLGEVSLTDIFNQHLKGPICKAIHAAEKKTDDKEPIVYMHLPEVIKSGEWGLMREAIQRLARAHFSKMFNEASKILKEDYGERERPVDDLVLPLLVRERDSGSHVMRSKFLLLRIHNGKLPELPDLENVRFYDPQSDKWEPEYRPGVGQALAGRYDLLSRVYEILQDPKYAWLRNFSVRVRTGEKREVRGPALMLSA